MTQAHPQASTPAHHSSSNGLGIASLVLGILSITMFSIFTGIPAIVTGVMGLKQPESKGMSIAGIVMGGFSVLVALLALVFFIFIFVLAANQSSYDSMPDSYYDEPYSSGYQQRT